MLLPERIVAQLPLTTLWTNEKELEAKRIRFVNKENIRSLLKKTPIAFVLADVGSGLKWIEPKKCYQFWKEEVQGRLVDNPDKIDLYDFPEGYTYLASEWTSENREPIILLEKAH